MLKVSEAAKLAGVSKATLHRARSDGRLSASKDDNGHFIFEPSEVLRVFPRASRGSHEAGDEAARDSHRDGGEAVEMRLKLANAERERDAAQQLAEERSRTIEDLRQRLDTEGEERRKLTAMITDQRERVPAERPKSTRWWLVLGVGLLIGGAIAWAITQFPIASA